MSLFLKNFRIVRFLLCIILFTLWFVALSDASQIWINTEGVDKSTLGMIKAKLIENKMKEMNVPTKDYMAFVKPTTNDVNVLIVINSIPFDDGKFMLFDAVNCETGVTIFSDLYNTNAEDSIEKWIHDCFDSFEYNLGASVQRGGYGINVIGQTPVNPRDIELYVLLKKTIISRSELSLINRQLGKKILIIQSISMEYDSDYPIKVNRMANVDINLFVQSKKTHNGLDIQVMNKDNRKTITITNLSDIYSLIKQLENKGVGVSLHKPDDDRSE